MLLFIIFHFNEGCPNRMNNSLALLVIAVGQTFGCNERVLRPVESRSLDILYNFVANSYIYISSVASNDIILSRRWLYHLHYNRSILRVKARDNTDCTYLFLLNPKPQLHNTHLKQFRCSSALMTKFNVVHKFFYNFLHYIFNVVLNKKLHIFLYREIEILGFLSPIITPVVVHAQYIHYNIIKIYIILNSDHKYV